MSAPARPSRSCRREKGSVRRQDIAPGPGSGGTTVEVVPAREGGSAASGIATGQGSGGTTVEVVPAREGGTAGAISSPPQLNEPDPIRLEADPQESLQFLLRLPLPSASPARGHLRRLRLLPHRGRRGRRGP